MAENKKSFVMYADMISTFKELTNEEAGILLKHLLAYVNDEDPTLEDRMLRLLFEPIKAQLKRDLKKYEVIKKRRSEAGRQGGLASGETRSKDNQNEANEANASDSKQNEANEAVNVNDNVTDNVTVTDNEINKINLINGKPYLISGIYFPFSEKAKSLFNLFIGNLILGNNRAAQTSSGQEYHVRQLIELSKNDEKRAIEILEASWAGGWKNLGIPFKNTQSAQGHRSDHGKPPVYGATQGLTQAQLDAL